jgi:hypothetical protein
MFGRRSHSRFTISPASDGLLRIVHDVIVQQSATNELIAISREPGVVGQVFAVQIMGNQGTVHTVARITDSRPLMADGAVRHQLRLERVQALQPEI